MCNDTCFIRIRMEEGDKGVEEEADSAEADTTKKNPDNTTSTTGKMLQMHEAERLVEGGAIMTDQADKTTLSSVDTMANLASTRQSVAKRRVSRSSQVDNSPTTPPTMLTMIVVECL